MADNGDVPENAQDLTIFVQNLLEQMVSHTLCTWARSLYSLAVAINLRLTGVLKLNPRQKMHNDVKHERALWQHLCFLRVFLLFTMSGMLIAWDVFIFDDRDEKQQLFCIFNFTVVWRSDSILIVAVIMSMFWDITLYSFRRKCRIISLQYH